MRRYYLLFLLSLSGVGFVQCSDPLSSVELEGHRLQHNIYLQKDGTGSRGTLIGIEPVLSKYSYATEENLYQALDPYFRHAQDNDALFADRSVVVLPEYIGTWLIATGEDRSIFEAETIDEAMQSLVIRNAGSFARQYLFATTYSSDALKETLFRMKAESMAERYQSVFSRLAKEYRVSIVAGSIVLPHPEVKQGRIVITDGPLENVSFYFKSDGSVDDRIIRKGFPIAEEKAFLKEAKINENPSIDTPIGRLYTMICADSWFPDSYSELNRSGAELLAVPSMVTPDDAWTQKWKGYSGYANPADVDTNDIERITERAAWEKYSITGRLKSTKVRGAVNVFFRGRLWNMTAGGDAILSLNGRTVANQAGSEENEGRIYALHL